MQIPNTLPQWNGETVLIVVAGRQDAVFYLISNGTIERLDAFEILNPHYSDHEDVVQEFNRQNIIREFLQEFRERTKRIPSFSKLFIFAPALTKNEIASVLPTGWNSKVKGVVEGNFYYSHPLELVRKLSLTFPCH